MFLRRTIAALVWTIILLASSDALSSPPSGPATPEELSNALRDNSIEGVRTYIANGGDPNAMGCRALYLAYRNKQFAIAKYLESAGAIASPRRLFAHYMAERQSLIAIEGNVKLFFFDHKRFPSADELFRLLAASAEKGEFNLSKDYWGNPYTYRVEGKKVILASYGSDGVPGGKGFARDIYYDSELDELERTANQGDPDSVCEK